MHASDQGKGETAIEQLFRAHYGQLRDYGLKLVSNASLVEDAIQDVFLTLWNGPTCPSEIAHPKSYLITAVRRRILERKKARERRHQRDQWHAGSRPSFALSHEALLINNELCADQKARLEKALGRLSDRRKEALYHRFYHGLTYTEIADVMEIRPQSARNYVYEALEFLRKQPYLNVAATGEEVL